MVRPVDQQKIVFAVVLVTATIFTVRFYRGVVAGFLARWFLKRGQVKWAMKFRAHSGEGQREDKRSCH